MDVFAEASQSNPGGSDAGLQKKDGDPARVLVVDDEETQRDLMSRMLQREGHSLLTADGGQAALQLLAEQPADVILLDVMMPGMDGFTTLEKLRADPKTRDIPVILITAKDDTETKARGMNLGVSEFIPKPVDPKELRSRVAIQIHARRSQKIIDDTVSRVS